MPVASATFSSQEVVVQHETGYDDNTDAMTGVFIESADLDVSSGEQFSFVKRVIPDVRFIFDTGVSVTPAMNVVVKRRDYTNQTLTTDSTTKVTNSSTYSNVRSRARQVVFRFESDDDNTALNQKGYKWRLGSTRIDLQASGRRG